MDFLNSLLLQAIVFYYLGTLEFEKNNRATEQSGDHLLTFGALPFRSIASTRTTQGREPVSAGNSYGCKAKQTMGKAAKVRLRDIRQG